MSADELNRSDLRTVAKGGAVQIIGQISQRLLSFAFFLVGFNLLGKAGYGLYRQVSQVLSIASQVGLAGLNYASMRFITRARAAKTPGGVKGAARVGITGSALASAVVTIAIVLLADPIARGFADKPSDAPDIARLLRLGVAYVPLFALMQVLRYCTQAYKTMVPSVIAGNIIQPAVRFLLGVSLLATGFGVAGAISSMVISLAVGAIAAAWYFSKILTEEERKATPAYQVGPMIRFALPQAGASLLGIQTLGLPIILLGIYGTNAEVGLFAAALSLQGPGTVFLGGIVNIWAPVVSDLHEKGEIARLGALYKTINRWIATFSFPYFAVLILQPDLFLRFAGPEALGAGTIAAILAVGNFFYTGTGPTGYVISMTGRPVINFVNSIISVALYVLIGIWVVPRHGIVGMACVHAALTSVVNIVRVVEAKLIVGIQPFGRSFFKPVLATAAGSIVVAVIAVLTPSNLWTDIFSVVVGAFAYLAVLKVLGIDEEERYVLDRIRKRALKGRKKGPAIPDARGDD